MDVITEKPRPVVPHCGACCGASGPGQGAHAQYRPARSEAVTWPTGPGCGGRGRWRNRRAWLRRPWAAAGPGRASKSTSEPSGSRVAISRAGRRPRAHQAARPTGTPSNPVPQQNQTAPGTPARPTGTPSSPTHGHQPTDTHQTSTPEATESGPEATESTPEATQSGPEPLGSGPPSILSDYRRCAPGGTTRQVSTSAPPQSAVSSARPPCRPCRSSRR